MRNIKSWERTRRAVLALVLAVSALLSGCAGKAPDVTEPAVDDARTQIAYNHFTDGALAFSMGNYAQAAESYERALRHDPNSFEIRLSLAESYFRLRQFPRAVTVAGVIEPKSAEVYDLLGRAYGHMGQNEDAREAYLNLIRVDSSNTQAYWFLSRLALRRGYMEEASGYLEHLAVRRPNGRIFDELGELYTRMGRPEDAVRTYRTSLARDSSAANRRAYLGLAAALEALDQLDDATAQYNRVLAFAPEDLATRRRLVQLHLRNQQYDSAAVQIESILKIDPDDPERVRLGIILYNSGELDRADSLFQDMFDTSEETDYLALFYMGRIAQARDDFARAKEHLSRATVLNDTVPDAWIHWGNTLLLEDSLSAAVALAHRGMAVVGDPEPFWFFLGTAFGSKDMSDSAVFWLDKAWRADTANGRTQFALAASLERAGRFADAVDMFTGLVAREPSNGGALNYLGYMYADSGVHLEESLRMIEKALAQEPDNGAYLDSFGWVLYRLGRYDEAEEQIRRALTILESDPTIIDHLGDILAATGRRSEAREIWQQALALDPDNHLLREKLRR